MKGRASEGLRVGDVGKAKWREIDSDWYNGSKTSGKSVERGDASAAISERSGSETAA